MQYVITKRVAKHGRQAVIVIPKDLQNHLPPHTLLKITMDIVESPKP